MRRWAGLWAQLEAAADDAARRGHLAAALATSPPAEAAWTVRLLLGGALKRAATPARLRAWVAEAAGVTEALVTESLSHVGDLGETLTLLLDTCRPEAPQPSEAVVAPVALGSWFGGAEAAPVPLAARPLSWVIEAVVAPLQGLGPAAVEATVRACWAALPRDLLSGFNALLLGLPRRPMAAEAVVAVLAARAGLSPTAMAARLARNPAPTAASWARWMAPATPEEVPGEMPGEVPGEVAATPLALAESPADAAALQGSVLEGSVLAVLVNAEVGPPGRFAALGFAVWQAGALVPVARVPWPAVEQTPDVDDAARAELAELEAWIGAHTLGRFGPVRTVAPERVFEVGFAAATPAPRRKAGLVLEGPRLLGWRPQVEAAAAATVAALVRWMAARAEDAAREMGSSAPEVRLGVQGTLVGIERGEAERGGSEGG